MAKEGEREEMPRRGRDYKSRQKPRMARRGFRITNRKGRGMQLICLALLLILLCKKLKWPRKLIGKILHGFFSIIFRFEMSAMTMAQHCALFSITIQACLCFASSNSNYKKSMKNCQKNHQYRR
jgi:hypothetical protein